MNVKGTCEGKFLKVICSSVNIVAANIGKAAFFAPEQEIDPESSFPPTILSFSIFNSFQMEILCLSLKHAVDLIESDLSKHLRLIYGVEAKLNPQIVHLR